MKLISQIFEAQGECCLTICLYEEKSDSILEYLIKEHFFDIGTRPTHIQKILRTSDSPGYLQGLFNSKKLSIEDFRFVPHQAIYYYLEGFSETQEEWGEDKPLFKELLRVFKENYLDTIDGCFLINKEWFDENSEKVRDHEFMIYDFYLVIIWKDKKDSSKVYISEWSAD